MCRGSYKGTIRQGMGLSGTLKVKSSRIESVAWLMEAWQRLWTS